jgi:hypothetical protein
MNILNETPFAVATMLWQDIQGQLKLSVILKVTCTITSGNLPTPAAKQLAISSTDEYSQPDTTRSVRLESDMVPFKPYSDVILVGQAYAPGGHPVTWLNVTVRVGTRRKIIRVFGDRHWWFPTRLALVPMISRPRPFVTMDLVYERAFGGIDAASAQYCKENLVGKGFIGKKSKASLHGRPLPNLEDPNHLIRSWKSRPKPVGFGFYDRGWMPRVRYAGTYDERYRKERAPALPVDFSYAIYNGAHPDLQVEGYLRGDEEVELINVSQVARLRFRLPGIRPNVTIAKWAVPPEEWIDQNATEDRTVSIDDVPTMEEAVPVVLDTLVFIPDERIFYEVFRGVCPLTSLETPEVAHVKITV